MVRRGVYFAAVLLTAWVMGLELAHVLEWPVKAGYDGALYVRLQESLYLWFGNVGAVIYVLAIGCGVTVAVLVRRNRRARRLAGVAAALEVVGLGTFFGIIYPVNLRLPVHGSAAVPPDWTDLRLRWELGHAIGFALFTIAFALQVWFLLDPRRPEIRGPADDASAVA